MSESSDTNQNEAVPATPAGSEAAATADCADTAATVQPAETTATAPPKEIGGRDGPEPVRYGDWEKNGRCIDF